MSTITRLAEREHAAVSASKITAEGSAPDFCLIKSTPGAARPNFELLDGSGAKGIRRAEDDAGALFLEAIGQLADGGGFSGAVYADNEEHARRSVGIRGGRRVGGNRQAASGVEGILRI